MRSSSYGMATRKPRMMGETRQKMACQEAELELRMSFSTDKSVPLSGLNVAMAMQYTPKMASA